MIRDAIKGCRGKRQIHKIIKAIRAAEVEVANGKGFSVCLNYNLQLSEHRRYEF